MTRLPAVSIRPLATLLAGPSLALLLAPLPARPAPAGAASKPPPAPAESRERRWGEGRTLTLLPFTQAHRTPRLRTRYELLIPPADRPAPLARLLVDWPSRFDGSVVPGSVRLCRMVTPPQAAVTRCAEALPARVEPAGPRALRVVPDRPLAGAALHGLALLLFNPSLDGLYPVRLWSEGPAGSGPLYVGTWLLRIETEGD